MKLTEFLQEHLNYVEAFWKNTHDNLMISDAGLFADVGQLRFVDEHLYYWNRIGWEAVR